MSDRKKTTLSLGNKRTPKAESNHKATPDTNAATPTKSPSSKTLGLSRKRRLVLPTTDKDHPSKSNTAANTPAQTNKTLGLTRKRRLVLPLTEEASPNKQTTTARSTTTQTKTPAWKKKATRKIVVQNIDKPRTKLNKAKFNKGKKPAKPKKPTQPVIKKTPPSTIKAKALDEWLQQRFVTWRTYQPLVIGVHKRVLQLVGREQLPYSKRVVQKVLAQHTRHETYQANLAQKMQRVPLDA